MTGTPTSGAPSRTSSPGRATCRRPAIRPTLPEVAATFAAIEVASGPAAKAALLHELLARSDPLTAKCDRQGARRRAPHRAARGPRRGRHRQGLRSAARGRQVGRDADRRHGPPGGARPRRSARRRRAGALPPAQVHARLARRGRRRDHHPPRARGLGRGQVRRHPGAAPQARQRTSGCTRATSTTSAASSRRSSRRRDRSPGTASSTARSWRARTGSCCRSSASRRGSGARRRPAAIQAEVPVIYVAFDLLALGPGDDADGDRTVEPLLREPLRDTAAAARRARPAARRRTAAGSRGRSWPSARDADELEAAFAEARGRRNEGLMVKDPTAPIPRAGAGSAG